MVKEIMGQSMVEAFCFDASKGLLHLKRCTQKHKKVSLFPIFSCSSALTAQHEAPFVNDEYSKTKSALGLKPVTLMITGTVTINNIKTAEKGMMAKMLQHFDTFNNTLRGKGMTMQLVSTEIDPSKHLRIFLT